MPHTTVQAGTGQGAPVSIAVPGGTIPLEGIPQTEQQVEGLRTRIEMLEEQIDQASGQRNDLARDVRNGLPEGPARTGVEQRIAQIDQHILQLERDKQLAERQLNSASPELLASTVHIDRFDDHAPGKVDEDEATIIAMMTFVAGIIVSSIVGRIRRRRYKKPLATAASVTSATDPRIERLTQAVDAIAEEVERIGEGQRFVTNLLADRREASPVAHLEQR